MTKTFYAKNKIFFSFKVNDSFKDFLLSLLILMIMAIIIFNPKFFSSGTISGLKLFFFSVFPGLFPFMFLTKLLTNVGFVFKVSNRLSPVSKRFFGTSGLGFYAFFMSILSGYPIGAQIIGDLYSKNLISQKEAEKMSLFCTTSGPIFVIGAVGSAMLGEFKLGVIIYVSHILSSLLLGLVSNLSTKTEPVLTPQITTQKKESGLFSKCLNETINSILIVGGYITIFYLISELLCTLNVFSFATQLLAPLMSKLGLSASETQGILYGIVEITRGCKELSNEFSLKIVPIISGLISFSGISIIMQSLAFLKETKIKMHTFVFGKVVHSILSILVCQLLVIFAF